MKGKHKNLTLSNKATQQIQGQTQIQRSEINSQVNDNFIYNKDDIKSKRKGWC